MSPFIAWHHHIFRLYVLIAFGILLFAGIVLFMLQKTTKIAVGPIWKTYRGWLVMVPILTIVIFLGRVPIIAGVTALSLLGFREFARASGLCRDRWLTRASYLAIASVGIFCLVTKFALFMVLPIFGVIYLLMVPVLRDHSKGQLQHVALSILGFFLIGWMFGHLAFLTNSRNPYGYLIFVLTATELNDVAAFTFGKLLGRRPLRANISPNKTWGGAIGAVCFSLVLPWLLRFSLPGFSTGELIATGLIVGIGGQLGDLAISFIKRDLGIKNMGTAIPGHGGILDRIDSLIFVAPLFLHLIGYCNSIR
jgi:phosphatidate cytidylyltransferase